METVNDNASIVGVLIVITLAIYGISIFFLLVSSFDVRDEIIKKYEIRREAAIILSFLFVFLWPIYLLFIGFIKSPDGTGYVIQFFYSGLYLDKIFNVSKRKRKNKRVYTFDNEELEVIDE